MEIGVYTFGDVPQTPAESRSAVEGQRLRDLIEEVELADQVGLDVYGVGEHHRPDYAISLRQSCLPPRPHAPAVFASRVR